jgi:hypothetical protein
MYMAVIRKRRQAYGSLVLLAVRASSACVDPTPYFGLEPRSLWQHNCIWKQARDHESNEVQEAAGKGLA